MRGSSLNVDKGLYIHFAKLAFVLYISFIKFFHETEVLHLLMTNVLSVLLRSTVAISLKIPIESALPF